MQDSTRKMLDSLPHLKSVEITVDGQTARDLLELNQPNEELNLRNRPQNVARVNELAETIRAGEWELTHQGLAVNTARDRLMDGQNRLAAIALTGAQVQVFITAGVEAFDKIDTGGARNAGQVLYIAGYGGESPLLATAIKLIILHRVGPRPWNQRGPLTTPAQIRRAADREGADIAALAPAARKVVKRLDGGSPGGCLAGLYIAGQFAADNDLSDVFEDWLDGLVTGVGIMSKVDGRLAVASWVNGARRLRETRTQRELFMQTILRAFQAELDQEQLAQVSIRNEWSYYTALRKPRGGTFVRMPLRKIRAAAPRAND
jgi:hypothetical protein